MHINKGNNLESNDEIIVYSLLYNLKNNGSDKDIIKESLKLIEDTMCRINEPSDTLLEEISTLYKTCPGCASNFSFCQSIESIINYFLTKGNNINSEKIKLLVNQSTTEYLKGNLLKSKELIIEAKNLFDNSNFDESESFTTKKKILNILGFYDFKAVEDKVNMEQINSTHYRVEDLINSTRCAACKMYQHKKPKLASEFEKHCWQLIDKAKKEKTNIKEPIQNYIDRLFVISLIGKYRFGDLSNDEFIKICKKLFGNEYLNLSNNKGKPMHLAFIAETLAVLEVNLKHKSYLQNLKKEFLRRSNSVENICLVNSEIINFNKNGNI